jgi:hypothetical protein
MPYIIRPRQMSRIAAAFISSVLLLCAVPALAHANCPVKPTSKVFANWGDEANYTLVEGGLFISGAPNWSLGSAQIVNENPESWNSSYDFNEHSGVSHSLQIPDGGTVVSAPFCVDSSYPSFRFLAHRVTGDYDTSALEVSLRWSDYRGTHETADASLQVHRDWEITPVLLLASKLPSGVTPNVRLVLQPNGGAFTIDDVYLDPYSR